MQKKTTIHYQPGYAYFIITWSWIGFVYLLALIVQLELIKLNWQSITIALIGVGLTIANLVGYRLVFETDQITLKRPWFKKRVISRSQVTQVIEQRQGLLIKTDELAYQPEQLLLTKTAKLQLLQALSAADWPVTAKKTVNSQTKD